MKKLLLLRLWLSHALHLAWRWWDARRAKKYDRKAPIPSPKLATFDPMTPLLWLSDKDPFLWKDAFEGCHIFGGNGSGKTSGPGAALIKAFMRGGAGGLVMVAKTDEFSLIEKYARETGSLNRLIRFAPEEKWRFNFLAYEQKRPSRGAGQTANIVKLFTTVQESLEKGGEGGGKQERYWANALKQLLSNAVDLCLIGAPDEKLSVSRLYDVITSAPVSAEQVDSEAWQQSSRTYQLLEKSLLNGNLSPLQKSDLRLTGKFFLTEFPGLPHDTRGSIVSTFTTMADGFMRGAISDIFCTDTTYVPEMTLDGAIVVLDFSLKEFGQVGLSAQMLMKLMHQQCWERRDVTKNPRPVFLWADEAHLFVNESDVSCATTARGSRICFSYLSQSLPNYYWALGGEQKGKALTDSLMAVMQHKLFTSNSCPVTTEWAATLIGKEWQQKNNFGTSRGDQGNRSSNAGSSDSFEYLLPPSAFTKLRKGGPPHFVVDCIIHGGGRTFNASREQYLKTTFRQQKGK